MSDRITFSDIIQELSDRTAKTPQQCQKFVEELTELVINEVLENEKAAITNFGSFSKVEVSEREGINPANGQPMTIPAHVRVGFSPYKSLEEAVNAPFAHLEPSFIEDEDDPDMPDEDDDPYFSPDEPEETEPEKKKLTAVEKYKKNQLHISREQQGGPWGGIIITLILLLAILFGIWWAFFRTDSSSSLDPSGEQEQPRVTQQRAPQEPSRPASSVATEQTAQPEPKPVIAAQPAPEQPASTPAQIPDTYTVSGGDWMYDIARKVYGDPDLWALIYKANQEKMDRPDDIRFGLVLSIPPLEGTPGSLTKSDSMQLSEAYFVVAEAYRQLDRDDMATQYLRHSTRYSRE